VLAEDQFVKQTISDVILEVFFGAINKIINIGFAFFPFSPLSQKSEPCP
jgi:hypothetical protein